MGGLGSGWYGDRNGKQTTSGSYSIDIRQLFREGSHLLGQSTKWNWSVNGKPVASVGVLLNYGDVCITYRHKIKKDYWSDEAYTVDLEWTDCHYGGQRPWFQCPNRYCSKRVAILYIGDSIGCRQCRGLVYESQRENECNRSSRAADKLRDRLGWKRGFLHGKGYRPKGMHRATFERLASSHQHASQHALKGLAERFNLV
jgi:hypothetical protein